jgi:hypothetical protein
MAETKPIRTTEVTANAGERTIRTYEEALSEPPLPPTPTQEEADAIKEGTYGEEAPPPEGETQEQRQKREEDKRQRREAKPAADQQAGYQTR